MLPNKGLPEVARKVNREKEGNEDSHADPEDWQGAKRKKGNDREYPSFRSVSEPGSQRERANQVGHSADHEGEAEKVREPAHFESRGKEECREGQR